MGLANQMKSLSEEMLSSFKERVKDNEALVADVAEKMKQYRDEQEETAKKISNNAAELKKTLDSGEKDRLGKYAQLIGSIQKDIDSIEKEVKDLIQDFSKARTVLASDLNKFFTEENTARAQNEKSRMAEYELYIGKISAEVSSIFNYTNEMLERFGTEHKEMSDELRAELNKTRNERFEYTHALLKSIQERIADIGNENLNAARKLKKDMDQGEADRLKEYNTLFERISREVTELRTSTASLLDNCSADRAEGAGYWKEMQEKIAAIRSGGEVVTSDKIEKPVVKVAEKTEIKAVINELPVFEEKMPVVNIETPQVASESTLEEKILQYINSHHEGVKVSDMEEPLHETRMKIGFAAKCLLDAGKVSKVENLYYPIKKTFK